MFLSSMASACVAPPMYEKIAPTVAITAVNSAIWLTMLPPSPWAACCVAWSKARRQRVPGLAAHDDRRTHGHLAEMRHVFRQVPRHDAVLADHAVRCARVDEPDLHPLQTATGALIAGWHW